MNVILANTGAGHALSIDHMDFSATTNPELLGAIAWAYEAEHVFEGPLCAAPGSAHFCWFAWTWAFQLQNHAMGVRFMNADILSSTHARMLQLAVGDETRANLNQVFSMRLYERTMLLIA